MMKKRKRVGTKKSGRKLNAISDLDESDDDSQADVDDLNQDEKRLPLDRLEELLRSQVAYQRRRRSSSRY